MKNEVAIIDPKEYGLEEKKAVEIESAFAPKIIERDGLLAIYSQIITEELSPEVAKRARECRLKLVKARTGIAEIHKTQKAYALAYGKFCDAWKNKETLPIEQAEAKLEEIETYIEKIEAERTAKLKAERIEKLSEVCDNSSMYPVEMMEEEAFDNLFNGLRLAKDAKEAELKRIEDERIAKEKQDEIERLQKEKEEAEERERIRIENERLKAEKEAKEKQDAIRNEQLKPYIVFIRDYSATLNLSEVDFQKELKVLKTEKDVHEKEAIKLRKAEADRIAEEMRLADIEREKQAKIQAQKDAELKRIQEENARIQKELQAKKEAEEKETKRLADIEKQKQLDAEKLAKSSDKAKIQAWIKTFEASLIEKDGLSVESIAVVNDIDSKFKGFIAWANKLSESL